MSAPLDALHAQAMQEAVAEAEEAAFRNYMGRHFPALRTEEPNHEQRLADMLSEPEPASVGPAQQQTPVTPTLPEIHQGPRGAAPSEDAEFTAYMAANFPQAAGNP